MDSRPEGRNRAEVEAFANEVRRELGANPGPVAPGQLQRFSVIALSLGQRGFRLRLSSEGWLIEPHHPTELKDRDGQRA